MRVVLTLLVRDELDVIAANLEHHLALGVGHVLVTDNGSVDGTRELLQRYEATGRVTVFDEPGRDFRQGDWVTRMARLAATDFRADWVVHADADEFWWPPGHYLPAALEAVDSEADEIVVPRANLVGPADESGCWWERMTYRDTRRVNVVGKPLQPKIAHRADPLVDISEGNHSARGPRLRRAMDAAGLEILHVPERSWPQYSRKIEQGAEAIARHPRHGSDLAIGAHWRAEYENLVSGGLAASYLGRKVDGSLDGFKVDRRLRDRLRLLSSQPLVSGPIHETGQMG
jgi:hypothetical protein